MIGDILGLGRRLQDKPLILTVLYKTFVFTVWVAVFGALEHGAEGLLHGEGLGVDIHRLQSNAYEVFASGLVVFVAFIPFFAFKELGQVLGEGKIAELFFRKRAAKGPDLSKNKTD